MLSFFAAAIPGTERALMEELRELGFPGVRLNRGGTPFRGDWVDGWRACLQSRIAQRIQVLLHRFPAPSPDALYAGVQAVDWRPYVTRRQTLAVSAVCRASRVTHSGFAALRVKDAIVDQIRRQTGRRPSVDRDDPDARVFLHLANDKAALYLDLSGTPLHRRGYRQETGEAPLRETLAAALLRMSGWDRRSPLIDPMCGSGTIAIEAALWASNFAPGLFRERFGFERWAGFGDAEADRIKAMRGELRRAVTSHRPRITAGDIDPAVLDKAQANARAAGVRLAFRQRSFEDLQPDGKPAILVTNPPYGVRLEKDPEFCRKFAAAVSRLHGWRVCLLAGSPDYERAIPANPVQKFPVSNGDLDCDVMVYDIP
jgi:putative N6-adenine-specific DNA methylase